VFGVPVLCPSGGTEWEVTGRWTSAAADLSGRQGWLLQRGWYRLIGDVAPWGRVVLWGQLPDDWIVGDPMAIPTVTPLWGQPWRTVTSAIRWSISTHGTGRPESPCCWPTRQA